MMTLSLYPPSTSTEPNISDSVMVEQAPYMPRNGICMSLAIKDDDIS